MHDSSIVIITDDDGKPIPCEHVNAEPRIRTLRNGQPAKYWQCLNCGHGFRSVRKDEREAWASAPNNPPFDPSLQETYDERYWALSNEYYHQYNHQKSQEWWSGYNAYLASDAWRQKRQACLERDRYICQARLSGCLQRADQVHHLTYDHRGQEPLFDLVSVCNPCHEKITAMDREKRAAR